MFSWWWKQIVCQNKPSRATNTFLTLWTNIYSRPAWYSITLFGTQSLFNSISLNKQEARFATVPTGMLCLVADSPHRMKVNVWFERSSCHLLRASIFLKQFHEFFRHRMQLRRASNAHTNLRNDAADCISITSFHHL